MDEVFPTPTRLADRPGDSDTTIDLAFSAGDVPGDVFWAPTYHGASDHLLCEVRVHFPRTGPSPSSQRPRLYHLRQKGTTLHSTLLFKEAKSRRRQGREAAEMPTRKHWWTLEVDAAWRNKRSALKHWRAAKISSDASTRESARSVKNKADALWKRITLSSKRRCWDVFLQESYRDSGQFWRFIGSMGDSKPQTSSMQMVAGSRILRTDKEKGSAFLQRLVDQCSRGDMARRDEAIRDLSSRLPQLAPSELFGMDDLTRAIERIGQVSPGARTRQDSSLCSQ